MNANEAHKYRCISEIVLVTVLSISAEPGFSIVGLINHQNVYQITSKIV